MQLLTHVMTVSLRVSPIRMQQQQQPSPPHVAVVGAGWGGWGAAKALVENGCRVTLLDALPDPTGKTPYLTPTGKPFEAGTRGATPHVERAFFFLSSAVL